MLNNFFLQGIFLRLPCFPKTKVLFYQLGCFLFLNLYNYHYVLLSKANLFQPCTMFEIKLLQLCFHPMLVIQGQDVERFAFLALLIYLDSHSPPVKLWFFKTNNIQAVQCFTNLVKHRERNGLKRKQIVLR